MRAYYNRGLARFEQQKYNDAIADYNQALLQSVLANTQVATLYNDRGLAQSLERNPDQAEAYVNRGIDRYQMGYQQAALEDLLKGAECFCHQGQMVAYQQTLNLIKKLQQQSPSNEETAMA